MTIVFHKNFEKHFKKLTRGEQNRFKVRLAIFTKNPFHPLLRNHSLQGTYSGYRSIDIGGDLRAIYKMTERDAVVFVTIGSHHTLYE